MCGGAGGNQSVTSTTRLPAWLEEKYKGLLERGEDVADLPYVAYGGPRLAPFTADQEAAFQGIRDASGAFEPDLAEARRQAGIAAMPMADTVGSFDRAAYDRYADPFNQAVIDATIADIGRTGELARRDLDARAGVGGGIGSYGPSERATLERSEQWRDQSDATARAVAQLRSQGYAQARDQFNTEQNRGLAARQNDAARAAAAAGQYLDIGGAGQDYALRGAGARYGIGATQQGQAQRGLDISYADFLEQRGYPAQQTEFLSGIYRGYPGGAGTTTQTVPGANPWAQGIGAGIGILGATGAFPSAGYSGWLGGLFKRGGVVGRRRYDGSIADYAGGGIVPQPKRRGPPPGGLFSGYSRAHRLAVSSPATAGPSITWPKRRGGSPATGAAGLSRGRTRIWPGASSSEILGSPAMPSAAKSTPACRTTIWRGWREPATPRPTGS